MLLSYRGTSFPARSCVPAWFLSIFPLFLFLEPWGGGQPTTSLSTLAIQTLGWLPGTSSGDRITPFPAPFLAL